MALRAFVNGSIFAETIDGDGPPILALHGWRRDRSDLLPMLNGRQVCSVDFPGFGASPEPPEPWGAADYATNIVSLIKELDSGPQILVGHSFGGRVAACLGAQHPELVSGIVFAGTPLIRRTSTAKPALKLRLVKKMVAAGVISEQKLENLRRRYGSADYNAATGIMRDVFVKVVNEDYSEELKQLRCPVGLVWGSDDTAAPLYNFESASELVANVVDKEIVTGVGHDVHRDAPEIVQKVLDSVISGANL